MCDFSVITRFGFRSLCDNGIKSRSSPFHFGWRILPFCPWGKEVPWLCVGEESSYLTCSLYCLWWERKTLRVLVRLLFMGPRVCILERTISCQLWMGGSLDRSMWQCGRFMIIYLMLDIMVLEIILLMLTNYII